MSPTDHRAEALDALALIQASDNPLAEMSSASEATAHALLAIEQRLGELLEQQKTANLIAMLATVPSTHGGEIEWPDIEETVVRRLGVLGQEGENH